MTDQEGGFSREKYVTKVQGLLAKAERAGTEAEAETFLSKAQELIAGHDRSRTTSGEVRVTTTPDLSEDYPILSQMATTPTCANQCRDRECAEDREARCAITELAGLRKDVANLLTWKAEAIQVLSEWEKVWEAAGQPGPLGRSKAENVLAYVEGAERDVAFLRHHLGLAEEALAADRARRLRG